MNNSLLINIADFEGKINLPKSFSKAEEVSKIDSVIRLAQDLDIRPMLTEDFFDEILFVAKDGAAHANLTVANFELLLPYLVPAVVYFSGARLLDTNQITITRYGAVSKGTAESTQTDQNGIQQQIKSWNSIGIAYMNRLINFLNMSGNIDKYPTWKQDRSDSDEKTSTRISSIDSHSAYISSTDYINPYWPELP